MAPAKPRANADDSHGAAGHSKADAAGQARDKNGGHHHGSTTAAASNTSGGHNSHHHHPAPSGKARRAAAASNASASAATAASAAAAHLQQQQQQKQHQQQQQQLLHANAGAPSGTADAAATLASAANPTIQWNEFERGVLHGYRRAYHLDVPGAFASEFSRWVLSQPGSIGLQSPTMRRRRPELLRQGKTQLANAARKHFNGLGVQENDIVVDFLHKVQTHEVVRLRRPRRMGSNAREMDG